MIITSRTRLSSLNTTTGAQLLTLDTPDQAEARNGFMNRIGQDRARSEKAALNQVIVHAISFHQIHG
ncbi:hypothetical protein [Winogradskya consettensis]|uniref:hypothetical protein n=1 Tax=Winogradskya consettensis TaxID=113560 RepID=UPI001BB3C138|nr:hypothetical protein [Actinoplanes consettensis]